MDKYIQYIVIIFSITCALGSKILLAPFSYSSHVNELVHIGDELMKNGHKIHIMLSSSYPNIEKFRKNSAKMPLHEYRAKYKDFYLLDESESPMTDIIGMHPMVDFRINIVGFEEFCYNALEDEEFFERIKIEKFDLGIIDAFPCSRCFYILFYKLGIPYVSMTTQYEPWLYRVPALPSFVPFGLDIPPKTQEMTFLERLKNTYAMVDWSAEFVRISYLEDSMVAKYAPEMPFVTLNWLAGQSLLWLIDTDVAIDYPRPTMPNEINVGGLSTTPPKPLTKDVQTFVEGAKDGVIMASFGSLDILTDEIFKELLKAYGALKQNVIMRYEKDPPEATRIPGNVKLMKWVPQNDLLGHPNTKLFISHGGANSQFEALYHAVPMVMFPLFADQYYNARRGEYKGYSVTMDILNFSADELVSNIKKVLNPDNKYKERIQRCSDIFNSAKLNPRQRAVFWVEHVMKHGGAHLRSYALDMPWYQYLMLDIFAFVLAMFCFAVIFIALAVKIFCDMCCRKQGEKIKKN